MLETALVSSCSAHENHEGGEYDIMILAAVQADLLSTTRHRQLWSFLAVGFHP